MMTGITFLQTGGKKVDVGKFLSMFMEWKVSKSLH
jgi:hypothetical protein